MIRSLEVLRNYAIRATDDTLGGVSDIYFDDQTWTVRHLVVDTGTWLPGRKVLLPTTALGTPDAGRDEFPVNLTKQQVKDAPSIDADKPVSRQHEVDLYGYYGWAPYWGADGLIMTPGMVADLVPPPKESAVAQGDPHLRSGREVMGYAIAARDGDVGHVEDILIDDAGWRIRYLLVDTRNWLPGRRVVISPDWVRSIDWASRSVEVDLTRDQVKGSPEFDQVAGVSRAYEDNLYRYYGQAGYWI